VPVTTTTSRLARPGAARGRQRQERQQAHDCPKRRRGGSPQTLKHRSHIGCVIWSNQSRLTRAPNNHRGDGSTMVEG
jgi:hypothetical protein